VPRPKPDPKVYSPGVYYITLAVETDWNMESREQHRQFERLVNGYPSNIRHNEILSVEVIDVKKEGQQ
jgi:hypothetical protein